MTTEQQFRQDLQSIINALNTKDWSALGKVVDETFDADYVWHLPGVQDPVCGREAWKQLMRNLVEASPDYQATLEDVFVVGDKAAARFSSQRRDPATGKAQRMTGLMISHFRDDRFAEDWEVGSPWEDET